MAYLLRFTNSNSGDPEAKSSIVIENYELDGPVDPNNPTPATNPDLTPATANTTLLLYGYGSPNYGERIQENLLNLMEHFYSDQPPVYPTTGQLWFDYSDNVTRLRVYDGALWNDITNIYAHAVAPTSPVVGQLWYDINPGDELNFNEGQLKVWDSASWISIAANYVNKTGDTMSGDLNMGVNRVTNMDAPVTGTDATNKDYVDGEITASLGATATNLSTHENNVGIHITPEQNTLLDNLESQYDLATVLGGMTAEDFFSIQDWSENHVNTISQELLLKFDKLGGAISGPIIMGLNKITFVGDATDPGDALSLGKADTLYLPTSGSGAMTGNLNINNNKIVNLANPNPSNPLEGLNIGFADNRFLNTGTGGVVDGTIDMNLTNKIIQLSNPTAAQDAATKAYVDLQVTGNSFRGALVQPNSGAPPSIPHSVWTDVPFTDEQYDTDLIHDPVLNNERLVVPAGVTAVQLFGAVTWNDSTPETNTGIRGLEYILNGGVAPLGGTNTYHSGFSISRSTVHLVTPVIFVTPGDFFTMRVFQSSGSANILLSNVCWFGMKIVE